MTAKQTCATLFVTIAVAGCTVPEGVNPFAYGARLNTEVFGARQNAALEHVITTDVPVSAAFVSMPQRMGTIVNVSETRAGNGVEQNIIYGAGTSANGENRVRIRMIDNSHWPKEKSEPISLESIAQRHIRTQLRREFPYASMRISNNLHTNAYGAFGYAVSRAKTGCFYGWQRMRAKENGRWRFFKGDSKQTKIGLRVRYCRPGATENELVGLMRNLRVSADPAAAIQARRTNWTARPVTSGSNVVPYGAVETGYTSVAPAISEPAPKPVVRKKPRRRVVHRTVVRERERYVEPIKREPSREFKTDQRVPLPPKGYVAVTPTPAVPRTAAQPVVPRTILRQPETRLRSATLPVLPAPSNAPPKVEMPTIRSTLPTLPPKPAPVVRPAVRKIDASHTSKDIRVIPLPG